MSLEVELDATLGAEDAILSFFATIPVLDDPEGVSEPCAEANAARLANGIRSGIQVFIPKLHHVRYPGAINSIYWPT
jgi:hypothetical protein